jgi:site-specific DNA-methyltransferase (adenine-specific)
MKDISNKSIDAIITDPPYGTTKCKWDTVIDFNLLWEQLNRIIKPNGAIVLFGSEPFSSALRMSNIKNYKYDWIWKKNLKTGFLNAKKMPLLNNEIISVFYKKPPTYNPVMKLRTTIKAGNKKHSTSTDNYGDYSKTFTDNQTDLIYPSRVIENINCVHNSSKDKVGHPTQKPVALMEYLIKTYTNENETILDFTMGSGSTGVSCKNTNRNFIGIEKDEKHFEIAEKRIKETKQQTKLF